jgi:predicted nucleotide-binding protein
VKRKRRIILVDNSRLFRETRCEFLEQAGYQVTKAATVEEARAALSTTRTDLAIIDVRLREDADYDDWSGLELARDVSALVPILLMSAYRDRLAEGVRNRLLPEFDEASVAVGFHTKQDGPAAMLSVVADLLRYPAAGKAMSPPDMQQSVFLAYGHNEPAKIAAGDFLRHNGLRVLELGQVAQYGDSILGNVDRYINQARFAVVLFTGDDEGYALKDGPARTRRRARQNVVFELGYLLAKLGQRRVRVLVEENLEIPTNYLGMLYIPFDDGHMWQTSLGRELRLSGININLKNVMLGAR